MCSLIRYEAKNFMIGLADYGGPTWIRTRDQPVMSRELYQLSYGPASDIKL